MIQRLVGWSVQHRGLVFGLTAGLALVGLVVGARLRLDALPDITNNQVLVLTRAHGLTPEEVERRVTRPIEAVLGGLPGLEYHRSLSRYAISAITVVFDEEMDPFRARQLVQERLNGLAGTLPAGVEAPEIGPLTTGLGEVFHFTLSSPERTAAELFELAQYKVAPTLRSVRGVVEVNTWGGQRRTFDVKVDPVRLAQRGLTLEHVRESLERATGTVPGAALPTAGTAQALVRAVARPMTPSELGHAVVSSEKGNADDGLQQVVRVADVAQVAEGSAPRIGAATANGRGETVYVMAQMLRGENALLVAEDVNRQLTTVRSVLPRDVQLEVVYDRSLLVRATLRTVAKNLGEGAVLVIAVLLLTLGSLRAGLLIASLIPLSMIGATSALVAFGVPGNLMSLGAIDFGLIVDGAVVMIEHIFFALRNHRPEDRSDIGPMAQAAAGPVFFSLIVILLVYVPILSLSGVDGKMFRPMALTVIFALLAALLLSLTYVPAVAGLIIGPRTVPAKDPWFVRVLVGSYLPLLQRAERHPRWVVVITLLALVGGGVLFARAGTEMAPQLDEGDLVIQTTRSADISLEGAIRDGGNFEAVVLAAAPEVRKVVSRIGSPAVATDVMGLEQADVFVSIAPNERWRAGLTRAALIEQLQQRIERLAPGSDPAFTQPIQMRFNELLGGVVTDVAVHVYGEDLGELRRLALQVAAAVRGVYGAADVRVLAPPDISVLEVRPRPLEVAQHGFAVAEILESVQAVRQGIEVGATYDGPVRIPIVLRLAAPSTALALSQLSIAARGGGTVPLGRVAEVNLTLAPSLVNHHNGERQLIVGFNVRGGSLGTVVKEARARVERALALPTGYRLSWGGQYETLEQAVARLTLVVPAVLALILGLLFVAFRRVSAVVMILLTVPVACVGGVATLTLRGLPISISAAVGFIALSGVMVLNGGVVISQLLSLERLGASPRDAVREAVRRAARPVLMTTLVAALGFLPMTIASGVGAEVQRPLATVVVGGLFLTAVPVLFLIVTVYPWLAGRRRSTARRDDDQAQERGEHGA